MKQRDLFFIAAGVGVLYFLTRPSTTYAGPGQVPPNPNVTPVPIPGVGSLVGSLSNWLGGIFNPGGTPVSYGNPGINVVTNPGAYPNTPPGNVTYDSGNPCDPASVQYNPDVCAELYPNG
jgi:hypothetical protein